MISEGKFHLSAIDRFRKTPAFYYALQMSNIPSASAVGDFIKRTSRAKFPKRNRKSKKEELVNGIDIIQNIFYETTKEIMKQMRSVLNGIIDYDASVIEENKEYSKKMYTGVYGTMGYFAFMGRICIMSELEPGNHSPSDKADLRTISCIEFCWQSGIKVKKMRADAASYIANLFNFCNKKKYRKIEFYIRAVSTKALKQSIETVVHYFGAGWKKGKIRQAKKIEGKEIIIGEATHSMDKTDEPFRLICEKKVANNSKRKNKNPSQNNNDSRDFKNRITNLCNRNLQMVKSNNNDFATVSPKDKNHKNSTGIYGIDLSSNLIYLYKLFKS
jgi:hypothetical protein